MRCSLAHAMGWTVFFAGLTVGPIVHAASVQLVCNGNFGVQDTSRLTLTKSALSLTIDIDSGVVTVDNWSLPITSEPQDNVVIFTKRSKGGAPLEATQGSINRLTGEVFVHFGPLPLSDPARPSGSTTRGFSGTCKPAQKLF